MNAGFSNLISLKKRLLLDSDAAGTTCDDAVAALGLGVAGLIEAHCSRDFARLEDAVHEGSAALGFVTVSRYPLESVSLLEMRDDVTSGWAEVDVLNFLSQSGLVFFARGLSGSSVRVTYTGCYWWDTSEDESGTLPAGATAIPRGLVEAWVQACKFFWDRSSIENRKKAGFTSEEIERFAQSGTTLPAYVLAAADRFRRLA
jgi:hypothetical protein